LHKKIKKENIPAIEIDPSKDFSWYREILSPTGKVLIICFSVAATYFEWTKFLREEMGHLDMHKLFVSDVHGMWFHGNYKGLDGFGCKVLYKFLRKKIREIKPKKLIMLGASKAGYGAILYGALLNADVVFSFSPQTMMDGSFYKRFNMYPRVEELKKEIPNFNFDKKYTDLRKVLLKHTDNKTRYFLFYGSKNEDDVKNAKHIIDLKNVKEYTLPYSHHKISPNFLVPEYLKGMLEWEALNYAKRIKSH
jgi:hypothetical protein